MSNAGSKTTKAKRGKSAIQAGRSSAGRWMLAVLAVTAALAPSPLHAEGLPPLLCIPSHSGPGEVPRPNVLVIRATGGILHRTSLGNYPQPASARWSADHRSILVAPSARRPLFFCRFDPAAHAFGPPQDVAAALGNPGARYQVHTGDFDWSRDGARLVLANARRLVILDLKTGRKKLLFHAPSSHETIDGAAWSPDGKRVAFSMPGKDPMGSNGTDVYKDLWVISADGSGLRRLGHGMGPSWSPDGSRLVPVDGGYGYGGGPAVVSYRSAGGGRRVLRAIKGRLIAGDVFGAVAYSPDGRTIAALGPQAPAPSRDGTLEPSLFLMDGAGRLVQTLVAWPQLGDISYSPYSPWLTW